MKISTLAGGAFLFGIIGLSLVAVGCTSTSRIAQNSRASVFLEEVTDWSFEASHPAVIDQSTILKLVKGLYSDESGSESSRMSAGGSRPMRVFSDEDAEFLAPLLAQGLSKAKPEQLVGFRLSPSAGSGSEPTAGTIYVQEDSIYLTVSKDSGPTTFIPERVSHTERAKPYAARGAGVTTTHVIDYHALAGTPMPVSMPIVKATQNSQPAPMATTSTSSKTQVPTSAEMTLRADGEISPESAVQLTHAKEIIAKKDAEIRMLRRESEWMKRELHERSEEIKALRSSKVSSKPAPKKKRAEAHPTR